ncbi:MAG: SPOR domain-containing protein [Steroidobacteraceae bacterium]
MRTLALLLILANACFFFWAHYIDVPEARVRATATVSKQPPRLVLADERRDAAATALNQRASAELTCVSVGPFNTIDELDKLGDRLQAAGFSSNARSEDGQVFAGYWVNLQGFATRADAQQVLNRLHAAGINDAYILPDEVPPNVLSLGLFSEQARAEQRRDAIAKLGFQPQVQTRTKSGETQWLDVMLQEPGQVLDPALLQSESSGIVRLETKPCPAAESTDESAVASSAATK